MGQILFWLEASLALVLLVAVTTAITCRLKRRVGRWLIGLACILVILVFGLLPLGILLVTYLRCGISALAAAGACAGGALFLTGAIVVRVRGRRKTQDQPPRRAAADWPAGILAAATAAAVLLAAMTFWNLDLAVRQQMAVARAEACMTAMALTPARTPESQNAAPLYRQAAESMKKDAVRVDTWLDLPADRFNPADEKLLALLAARAGSRELLHRAGQLPGCDFGTQFNPPDWQMTTLPEVGSLVDAADFLLLSARVQARAGRPGEALKDAAAIFAMAAHKAREPILISTMVATGLQRRAFDALQEALQAGPPAPEAADVLRLDGQLSFQQSFQNALAMEECFGVVAFCEPTQPPGNAPRAVFRPWAQSAPNRVFLWADDMAVYRYWMGRQRQLAGQPYFRAASGWDQLRKETADSAARGAMGIMTTILLPVSAGFAPGIAETDARHQLALLAVAAGRYRNARGAWPDTLAALAPAYLPAVPADPFTGEPLRLTRRPDGQVVIYSVGRDLHDDAGAPLDAKTHKGDVRLVLGAK